MSRGLVATGVLMVALVLPPAAAAQGGDAALAPLQGRWVVTGGEHNGKPMDAIKGGAMTIAGNTFEIRTASGNLLRGTLRVDTSTRPSRWICCMPTACAGKRSTRWIARPCG